MNIAHLSPSDIVDIRVRFASLELFGALQVFQPRFGLGGLFGQKCLVVIVGVFNNMS
jgi:hypothetical protein